MEPLRIEIQDIKDAQRTTWSHHRSSAVEHIHQGGVVYLTNHGEPVGQSKTVEELDDSLSLFIN